MSSTKKRRKKKKRSGLWALAAIAAVIVMVIVAGSYKLQKQLSADTKKEADLQAQYNEELQRSQDIEEYAKYTKTRKYIEEVAKEKLGLVYEDETIFKDEDGE
ncbi:MAG: septum formation initiator family protein [Lachnospiraceae bacterium]|nr:septum formation initiator family protein [Lachnospiraceae bacterium]